MKLKKDVNPLLKNDNENSTGTIICNNHAYDDVKMVILASESIKKEFEFVETNLNKIAAKNREK